MIISVRYQVLGPLEAHAKGSPASLGGPKQRLVLSVLLIEAGRTVSDDRLVDTLWPDEPPDGARHAIQTYVSELRRVLDDEIRREGGGYRLVVDPESVDAQRFETLVAAGRERLADAPVSAGSLLREALALWHGDPFGGVADAPIVRAETLRLLDLRLGAVEDRVAADLDAGRHVEVSTELEALTREHPFRERLHALHMLALYRSDRQADALSAYHRAQRWLADELGIDPSPELQLLERRILTQDPDLRPDRAASHSNATLVAPDMAVPDDGLAAVRGFELRETAGSGPSGTTYRAYQASIGREVAVKVLRRDVAQAPAFVQSFELRARRLAELDHPHVLPLLDWWREASAAYLVTPWMRGGSVLATLSRGPWSLSATLKIVDQVGGALDSAHRRGVVHGDLKASNVILDSDGNARVADFAIFLPSPAQDDAGVATIGGDVRSLAALAIHVLAGEAPEGDRPVLRLSRRQPDLPPDLVAVLAQATSIVASDRYERVADFLRDVRRAAGTDVVGLPTDDDDGEAVRNPYKGLQAFHESDSGDFFGREALIDRFIDAVGLHRLVVVAGPSGSGKSSTVRAGVLPAIRADRVPTGGEWLVAGMFPGGYPFEELETALSSVSVAGRAGLRAELVESEQGLHAVLERVLPPGRQLLLVIDQFEELWSLAGDAETRRLFIGSLVWAVGHERARLRVLATLRADFLDRVLEDHRLAEHVQRGLVLVTPLSPDELAQAVMRPARNVGMRFEPGLVDAIVRDVVGQPGALPLMQHALTELVVQRQGRLLSMSGYRAVGGVTGALGRRADDLYVDLSAPARAVARQIFLRLVTVDEQSEDVRRRVRRSELAALGADPRTIDDVLQRFGSHRLLSFDRDPVTRGPTVEVAHEALFREWSRLREWIDSRRDDLVVQRRLRAAAADWVGADRSPEYLISGGRLDEMERWTGSTDLGLTDDERMFLAASRERARAIEMARQRRRRGLLAGTSAAALIATGIAFVAFVQMGRAEAGEREAEARALAAASGAQLELDPDLALHLALEAVELVPEGSGAARVDAVNALHRATIAHRLLATADVGGFFVGFAGEDRMFSTGPPRLQPTLWGPDTGAILQLLEPGGNQPIGAAVSADGQFAAESFFRGQTIVWDLDAGELIARLGPSDGIGVAPSFSPDGSRLAVIQAVEGVERQSVTVYDIASGRVESEFEVGPATDVRFGRDGDWLAVADAMSSVVRLHDVGSGEVLTSIGDPQLARAVYDFAIDPSGEQMAILTHGPTRIDVRDIESGERRQLIAVGAEPGAVCFAGAGSMIVATAADELVHVWDTITGAPVIELPGSPQVHGLSCAPDGHRFAVSAAGGVARIFDLRPEAAGEIASLATESPVNGHWLPDGSLLVTHRDGVLRRYDSSSGAVLAEARSLDPQLVFWTAVSPHGDVVAAAVSPPAEGMRPTVSLLDSGTLSPLRTMDAAGAPLAFSPDGRLLLVGSEGAVVVDAETGAQVSSLRSPIDGGGFDAGSGVFLADGRHVVVKGAARPETWIYDVETGAHVSTACSSDDTIRVALDPAGERLAIADYPGAIEVWSVDQLLASSRPRNATCGGPEAGAEDGARILTFPASGPGGVRFTADGTRLVATSGFEGSLGIWDAASGESLLNIEHDGVVSIFGLSPDGSQLAIGVDDQDGPFDAIRIYALDVDELKEIARAKLTRALTASECRTYLPSERCDTVASE